MAIKHVVKGVPQVRGMFEPAKFGLNKGDLEALYSKNPMVLCTLDNVRTYSISETFWLDVIDFAELQKNPIA
jgi:hypothetical protein